MWAAPASGAVHHIPGYKSGEACAAAYTCVHYRTWAEGAVFNVNAYSVPEFTTHSYVRHYGTRGAEGVGQRVRNNAASMNNKLPANVLMFYSPNHGGNWDSLAGGLAGNLYYSANNNASFRVP